MGQQARQRATSDVAQYVAARALGTEADRGKRVHDLRQRLDGEPVQLDVLPGGDVGQIARVLLCQFADDAQLVRGEQAIGQADAHHEVLGRLAHAVLAAGDARAVALGVDAPPLEVELGPLRQHRGAALARKLAHFVPCLPWVLGELQAFGLLGLGLLGSRGCGRRQRGEVGHMIPENSLSLPAVQSRCADGTAMNMSDPMKTPTGSVGARSAALWLRCLQTLRGGRGATARGAATTGHAAHRRTLLALPHNIESIWATPPRQTPALARSGRRAHLQSASTKENLWRTSEPRSQKITSSAILVAWSAARSRLRATRIAVSA